jgi:DNA-binding response OmpR family regulator
VDDTKCPCRKTVPTFSTIPPSTRILLVDDEPGIRESLSLIFREYECSFTVAAKVIEALEEIKRHEFDLLLCDLNIERERDGYEVIRAMRASNPRCVTIVLTAFPDMQSAIEGIHLAIDDYIVKPGNPETLISILAAKLASRRPVARILSVSYDETLMRMRHLILQNAGYSVVSVHGYGAAMEHCKQGGFDLFVLGHSIPHQEKRKMVDAFRKLCPAPVISLTRAWTESRVDNADFHIEPEPEPLLELIAGLVSGKSTTRQERRAKAS